MVQSNLSAPLWGIVLEPNCRFDQCFASQISNLLSAAPSAPGMPTVVAVEATAASLVWLRPDRDGDAGDLEVKSPFHVPFQLLTDWVMDFDWVIRVNESNEAQESCPSAILVVCDVLRVGAVALIRFQIANAILGRLVVQLVFLWESPNLVNLQGYQVQLRMPGGHWQPAHEGLLEADQTQCTGEWHTYLLYQ